MLAGINSGIAGTEPDDLSGGSEPVASSVAQAHAGGTGDVFGDAGPDLLSKLSAMPVTESEEELPSDTAPTQPASPNALEASRAALAAALGGHVEAGFVDGMPATLFDARQASGNMEVDGSRARTAQEARLKEPKDSPKRRASNDVIMQFDLTVGDQPTEPRMISLRLPIVAIRTLPTLVGNPRGVSTTISLQRRHVLLARLQGLYQTRHWLAQHTGLSALLRVVLPIKCPAATTRFGR